MRLEDLYEEHPRYRETFEDRFWSKVEIRGGGECWPWGASTCAHGKAALRYGRFNVGGRTMTAHRVAYLLTHGEAPEGLFICHSCDNPPCCNPAHLFAGTGKDNADDRDAKGRGRIGVRRTLKGAAHPRALFTEEEVEGMRRDYARGLVTPKELVERSGAHRATIRRILSGQAYAKTSGVA